MAHHDKEYVYHYTSRDGLKGILEEKMIFESEAGGPDAVFGSGVYFTSLRPSAGIDKVIQNNYDNVLWRIFKPGMAEYYVQIKKGDLKGLKKVETKTRDVYLYPGDVDLTIVPHTAKKTDNSQESTEPPGVSQDNSPKKRHPRSRRKKKAPVVVDQNLTRKPGDIFDVIDALPNDASKLPDPDDLPAGVFYNPRDGFYVCATCHVRSPRLDELNRHLAGRRHRHNVLLRALHDRSHYLLSDKMECTITSDYDDPESMGKVSFEVRPQVETKISLTICNKSADERLTLNKCENLKYTRVFKLRDSQQVSYGRLRRTCIIEPGEKYVIEVIAKARYVGVVITPVHFSLAWEVGDRSLHMVRYIRVKCTSKLVEELRPKVPYKRPPRVAEYHSPREAIDGLPLPSNQSGNTLEREIPLGSFSIQRSLRHALNKGFDLDSTGDDERMMEILRNKLNMDIYSEKLSLLLHVEEHQMEVDIRRYDMKDAPMTKYKDNKRLLVLKVPGLAENRPSVLKGDHLFVQIKSDTVSDESPEYKGYVHNIWMEEVHLGFSQKLMDKYVNGMKFNVRFDFNRLPLRLMHRAAKLAEEHSLNKLLFPMANTICTRGIITPPDAQIRLYDAKLQSNPEQVLAVKHILAGSSRPAPYVIFGPPGTGKTVTVVEAMKQVYKTLPKSCILACAPSNSAADLMVERLRKHVDRKDILRMNALSRVFSTLPDIVKEVSNFESEKVRDFVFEPKQKLMKYRIIVCTLVTAGRLASANFPPGHFSHVFIDEAGHAVEPEAVIALAGIIECDIQNKDGGVIVLAGDPKQLGPVIRSPHAKQHGLCISLLERYMKHTDVYKRRKDEEIPYDPRLVVKLVKNYRSHPAILKLPNEYFYEKELETHADQLVRESLCRWEGLPKTGFPVVFHGVMGTDEREERSPSFFNPEETAIVFDYVTKLLDMKAKQVKMGDIGIISPYRKQVQKISQLLRKKNMADIKVGSVEEFQGQERKVIIISTVRSNPEFLTTDFVCNLGFLRNPKRFNVAITRAKALLIVVGNPAILSTDYHWRGFIKYCLANKAYTGCEFSDESDEMKKEVDNMCEELEKLTVQENDEEAIDTGGIDVSLVTQIEEPAWRGET